MFIQTEQTPNPSSLKFVFEEKIFNSSTSITFLKSDEKKSPFAIDIFAIDGILSFYICSDFVTITKDDSFDWSLLKPQILQIMMDYIGQKLPFLPVEFDNQKLNRYENLTQIEKEIVELIEDRVKPAVAMDGGDVEFVKYTPEDGIVYLRMYGACSGCPSSDATLKGGIKRMLQQYIPEVYDVAQV